MAARKPVTKRGPVSPMVRMNALYDTLDGISRLFGGSTVTYEEGEITITVPYRSPRTYSIEKDDGTLLVSQDVGTKARPRVETYSTYIEEPVAFLLEHTSRNDVFKDVYQNVADYADRELG
jgi:hypothetical protein